MSSSGGYPGPRLLDPDVMDPEVIDPEVTDPEVMDPEVMGPEVIDPEVMDPEGCGCPRSLAFGDRGTHEPNPTNRPSPRTLRSSSNAARRPFRNPSANAPSLVSGNNRCVAQSATAAAPAREHSRLISPKCNSFEVKYVYGESCL